jgi:hypothetical protein
VKILQIAGAAERVDGAVGGGDFSVRCHRHVDENMGWLSAGFLVASAHKISIASP